MRLRLPHQWYTVSLCFLCTVCVHIAVIKGEMVRTGCSLVTEHSDVQLQYCVCPVSGSEWTGFDLLAVSLPRSLVALLLTVRHLGRPSRAIKKVSCVRERWILGQDVLVQWGVETVGSYMLCLSFSGGKKTMWIRRRRQTALLQSTFLFMNAFKALFFSFRQTALSARVRRK